MLLTWLLALALSFTFGVLYVQFLTVHPIRMSRYLFAATLAFLGGALGVAAGWLLASTVSVISPLPARVTPWSISVALALGASIGIVFGVYPAARAARLDPVTALRQE